MKNFLTLLFISILIFSCKSDDDIANDQPDVVGSWQLAQIYLDPGDGSGDFVDVDSQKRITFFEDGTIMSNGSLCLPSPETEDIESNGTYSLQDFTITTDDCQDTGRKATFRLEGEYRIVVSYPCIEECSEKYGRILPTDNN